jgi:TRAP-type mannitol/chloroaromatic compound transport system permease small subunit
VPPAKFQFLATAAARLDAFTAGVGRWTAYLTLATVVICFANVYLRYAFSIGHVWLQESYVWTHAAAIMFGSAYALLRGGFVRVDTFYNRMSERGRAWVDLLGTVGFMGPFLWMMAVYGWPFFHASWRIGERSAYETGLPGLYLLKGTLMVFVFLVALQGLAIICRCLLTLLAGVPRGRSEGMAMKEAA